jgi:hypothetical protein
MKELKASIAKAHGGRAHHLMNGGRHPDEKADRSLVHKMVKPAALTGKKAGGSCHGTSAHAAGGAAKHKGSKTQVNVLVAPRGGQAGAPSGPVAGAQGPGPGLANLPSRPMAPAAPAGAPMPVMRPGAPAGPGALPAKRGGKVEKRAAGGRITGYDAGAMTGEGRLEKEAHMKRKGHVK